MLVLMVLHFYQVQLLIDCKNWPFLFLLNVYHLTLLAHPLMKVLKSLALFRFSSFSASVMNNLKSVSESWCSGLWNNLLVCDIIDSIILEVSSGGSFNTSNILWLLCHYESTSFKGGNICTSYFVFKCLNINLWVVRYFYLKIGILTLLDIT